MPETPKGMVGILTSASGHVMATATDFEPGNPVGMSVRDMQELRCRDALTRVMLDNLCHQDIAKAMSPHDRRNLLSVLVRDHGYRATYIPIGHEAESDDA